MNLSDLVERFFEEVQSTPSVQNDELKRTLVAAGADVPTACRIILFAPLASARVWYRSAAVSFPATFRWYGEGVDSARVDMLADEPVFIEALLATERRGLSRSQEVVERSSTFAAISSIMRDRAGKPLKHKLIVGHALISADQWTEGVCTSLLNPPETARPRPGPPPKPDSSRSWLQSRNRSPRS